ncbi:transposase domain-containing protein [Gluconacetobacter sp.]|uniref:transposase domain-containing protein n=1 Tax=Gluconacetobacter sp. TaxID=1935994 RepID=UPI0039EB04E8
MLTREWATVHEIADLGLPGIPDASALQKRATQHQWNRPEWRNVAWRPRQKAGGGVEYHYRLLDRVAQLAWMMRFEDVSETSERAALSDGDARYAEEWRAFAGKSERQKAKALEILGYLDRIQRLADSGLTVEEAVHEVRLAAGLPRTTVMNWRRRVKFVPRPHWLPFLAPGHVGCTAKRAGCDEAAWEFYRSDFLRPEKRNHADCYRDLQGAAEENGWVIPSAKTLIRWIDEIPADAVTLARSGRDAVKAMLPPQERDRTHMYSLEGVNADGHKFDVFVRWPDGTIARPIMVAWQDLYSNMILSWRVDRSENTDMIQLSLGDMVEKWGIPTKAYLDNGRAFASKRLTGGTKTRYRFKVKEGDVNGVMTVLGIDVHWASVYSGQSKPIERGFRDMAQSIAKHPAFAGAYVGHKVDAKPDNYGSSAVPLELFLSVLSAGIKEHNSRPNRDTLVCGGQRSFEQAFRESYETSMPRRVTPEQRHLWLMAAEQVTVNKKDGSIRFMGNRYWADFLHQHLGATVVVRFDPQNLHLDLHVFDAQGRLLGNAAVIERSGFDSTEAAAATGQAKRKLQKAAQMRLEAERALTPKQVFDLMPKPKDDVEELMRTKVVRPLFPKSPVVVGNTVLAHAAFADEDEDDMERAMAMERAERRYPRAVEDEEE